MAELLDDYVADMEARRGLNGKKATTIKGDRSRIANHVRPKLGRYRVAAITQSQIEDFINSMSLGSAGRILALVSTIFTFAISKKLRADNPCKGIAKPKDNRKTRRLSIAEYAQLGTALNSNAVNPTASAIISLLAISGWRSGEARLLKWTELDLPRQVANLADTKSGKSVRPLSTEAVKLIEAQPRNGEYVFAPKGKLIGNLATHFVRLKMPDDVSPHTLRHSFASLAADLGHADSTIAGLIGHKQQSITSRYLHLDKTLVSAANIVAAETLRLMRL